VFAVSIFFAMKSFLFVGCPVVCMAELSHDTKEFVVEYASKGYEPQEIRFLLRSEHDLAMVPTEDSIRGFVESEAGSERIDLRQEVRRKKAEVTEEDLVNTLVRLKDDLEQWHQELAQTNHGETRNDAVSNIVDVVNKIGELIGELDRGGGVQGNVVKIDEFNQAIDQDVNAVVRNLPADDVKGLAEALKANSRVKDFMLRLEDGEVVGGDQ